MGIETHTAVTFEVENMTLKDARTVRDELREHGLHSIVPLGHGPDKYFARIFAVHNVTHDFHSGAQARKYLADRLRRLRKAAMERQRARRPRSPIEVLIDRACGL